MVLWQTLYITPTKAPYTLTLGIPGLHGFAVTQPDIYQKKFQTPNHQMPHTAKIQTRARP